MSEALMMGFIAVPIILLYIINTLDKEHVFLKVLLMFFVFDAIFLIGAFVSDVTNTNITLTFFRHTIAIISTFIIYTFIYFIYSVMDYMGKLPNVKGKFRGWNK